MNRTQVFQLFCYIYFTFVREQVDELNQVIRQQEHQLATLESSSKELDIESQRKHELEARVRSLELQLQEQRSAELRLKNELSFAEERKASDQVGIYLYLVEF